MVQFYGRSKNFRQSDLGLIPMFMSELDPRPAAEQINERYAHGGGWSPYGVNEWRLDYREAPARLKYPGDPWMTEIARATLRDETILVFDMAIVAIVQKDGSFEVGRID